MAGPHVAGVAALIVSSRHHVARRGGREVNNTADPMACPPTLSIYAFSRPSTTARRRHARAA